MDKEKDKSSQFEDYIYREVDFKVPKSGNIIKAEDVVLTGMHKLSLDEDPSENVKVYIKKDKNDNIKEIKFVCSCGQTKTVILDYEEDENQS
ncbi:MAG TPA: hypothetical protein PK887_01660 [Ignavibacteriales bacterium]|jgi:hypothetical protein|nr:hypothetical protein [Ignavibacteriales bacterium]